MIRQYNLRKNRNSTCSLASLENTSAKNNEANRSKLKRSESTSFRSPLGPMNFKSLRMSLRKRKRLKRDVKNDGDSLSICSFNSEEGTFTKEPSSKRAKTIRKSVVSLANLISPGKPSRGKLQRSSSFKDTVQSQASLVPNITFKPYRPPSNTPRKAKNRRSQLWCETFDHTGLTEKEVRWQEAIYELYQGERDLVQDLTMAKQTYCDSMVTLKMLSEDKVNLIFGKLECLLPLHEQLMRDLENARGNDGRTLAVGHIFVEWLPNISEPYREYCANQTDAKGALDTAIGGDARVRDFLQRCLESPFSRKLDLWSYLDLPRTRLVKYPLLLKNTLKRTPLDKKEERQQLEKAIDIISEIIERVDETTGEQQCAYVRSKLEYLDEKQRSFVDESRFLVLQGQLKNNRGTKMMVFIFEKAVVLTRPITKGDKHTFQVYRQPVPMRSLVLEANSDADKAGGSFRGGILNSDKLKHAFRIKSEEIGSSYTLQANDEHDRKLWVSGIQEALTKYKSKHPEFDKTFTHRRRATYDTTLNVHKRNQFNTRRTSSDKSTNSNSSTTALSLPEESVHGLSTSSGEDHGLILTSTDDDIGLDWTRNRSNTASPALLVTSVNSPKKTSTEEQQNYEKSGARPKRNSSLRLMIPGPRDAQEFFKANSSRRPQRHVSLSGADTWNSTSQRKQNLQHHSAARSKSLTGSPQIIKSVLASRLRSSMPKNNIPSSPGKPPTGRPSSPYNLRSRSPSQLEVRSSSDLYGQVDTRSKSGNIIVNNKMIRSLPKSDLRRSVSDVQSRRKTSLPAYLLNKSSSATSSRRTSACEKSLNNSNSNNNFLQELAQHYKLKHSKSEPPTPQPSPMHNAFERSQSPQQEDTTTAIFKRKTTSTPSHEANEGKSPTSVSVDGAKVSFSEESIEPSDEVAEALNNGLLFESDSDDASSTNVYIESSKTGSVSTATKNENIYSEIALVVDDVITAVCEKDSQFEIIDLEIDSESDNDQNDISDNNNTIIKNERNKKPNVSESEIITECSEHENSNDYLSKSETAKLLEPNLIVECLAPSHGLSKCREEMKSVEDIVHCNLQTSI